ncbi:MAG: histidine kinase [Eubacteriales bacterium]|nr:histidine kinase [Eubacteriales bacterium]
MKNPLGALNSLRTYRFRSLWLFNFAVALVLIILPLTGITVFSIQQTGHRMNEQICAANEELLARCVVALDNVGSSAGYLSDYLMEQPQVSSYFERQRLRPLREEQVLALERELAEMKTLLPYVDAILLIPRDGRPVVDSRGSAELSEYWQQLWYRICLVYTYDTPFAIVSDPETLLFGTPYVSEKGIEGILAVTVNIREMFASVLDENEMNDLHKFILMDISNRILYSSDSQPLNTDMGKLFELSSFIRATAEKTGTDIGSWQGEQVVVSYRMSRHHTYKYALVTGLSAFSAQRRSMNTMVGVLLAAAVLLSVLAAFVITYVTYRPVSKILGVIRGEAMPEIEDAGNENELQYILTCILGTVSDRRQTDRELRERVQALRRAQVIALQLQINPHFLFNTLDTIRWMTVREAGMDNPAAQMIEKLAEMYRATLSSETIVVPLSEELSSLRLYVEILEIRHSGRIRFVWDVDESLLPCRVLKLCLQPVVENAVQHGLRPCSYRGTIAIGAKRQGDDLLLTVDNDGVPVPEEEAEAVNRDNAGALRYGGRHIGLRNVAQRIRLLYGTEYGATILPRNDGIPGTSVVLRLPLDLPSMESDGRTQENDKNCSIVTNV